jgi:hypothetical protein
MLSSTTVAATHQKLTRTNTPLLTPLICSQVLAGFVAAGAALLAAPKAQAVTPVDLFDDRKARNTGFDLIYEARDLDLPQSVRDGLTQVCWGHVQCRFTAPGR